MAVWAEPQRLMLPRPDGSMITAYLDAAARPSYPLVLIVQGSEATTGKGERWPLNWRPCYPASSSKP